MSPKAFHVTATLAAVLYLAIFLGVLTVLVKR